MISLRIYFLLLLSLTLEVTYAQVKNVVLGINQPGVENCLTGLGNTSLPENVRIYPNPSKGLFKVEVESMEIGRLALNIYNMNNQLLLTESINKSERKFEKQLDISCYPPGVYLLQLISVKRLYRTKIVLQ